MKDGIQPCGCFVVKSSTSVYCPEHDPITPMLQKPEPAHVPSESASREAFRKLLSHLRTLSALIPEGEWKTWSEEGPLRQGSTKRKHSVCIGDVLYDEEHTCVATAIGEDEQDAFAIAAFIARTHRFSLDVLTSLEELEDLVDDVQKAERTFDEAALHAKDPTDYAYVKAKDVLHEKFEELSRTYIRLTGKMKKE